MPDQKLSVDGKKYRVGILNTHAVQYYVPWYRALAEAVDLKVFYCQQQTAAGQARAGFGVEFDWDVPLFDGYDYQFLENKSKSPDVSSFFGCDTPEIGKIIQANRFDAFIVHGWYVKSFWQAMMACWRNSTPIFVRGDSQLPTKRNTLWRLLKYPMFRSFIPRFDGYLVVGKRARQYYLHYGAKTEKMFFVPHAVDNKSFSEQADRIRSNRDSLREYWGISKDSIVFLFVGKLIDKKRPMDFVKAIEIANKDQQSVVGLIVGDGPLRGEVESLINSEKLPIAFAGFLNQSEMAKAYVVSDGLVLPSDGGETWGLVVNEAMATGLPAIVSDQVGCEPDLIEPGITGEVFQCGSVESLAKVMIDWASDLTKVKIKGCKAKELIERYSIQAGTTGVLEALTSTVSR